MSAHDKDSSEISQRPLSDSFPTAPHSSQIFLACGSNTQDAIHGSGEERPDPRSCSIPLGT
jgi:hypothetical protein